MHIKVRSISVKITTSLNSMNGGRSCFHASLTLEQGRQNERVHLGDSIVLDKLIALL